MSIGIKLFINIKTHNSVMCNFAPPSPIFYIYNFLSYLKYPNIPISCCHVTTYLECPQYEEPCCRHPHRDVECVVPRGVVHVHEHVDQQRHNPAYDKR